MNTDLAKYFSVPVESLPAMVDLRGLEPPEPMEIILREAEKLAEQDLYLVQLPHIPFPLFPILERRGLIWQVHEEADGSALLLIRRNVCNPGT